MPRGEGHCRCPACETLFPDAPTGVPDLRLRAPKRVSVDLPIGEPLLSAVDVAWQPLAEHPHPAVDFSGISLANHLSRELLSHFPRATAPDRLMLDLGCGTSLHRPVAERAGFQYVGLDFANRRAPLLGDAQALPFRDATFDFILSIAVLEHVPHPPLMLREMFRVLRPGGRVIGTASFLEPFHGNSFQHHSHLGLYWALRASGFNVSHIAPGWDGLTAQTQMALLAGCPKLLAAFAAAPLRLLHGAWWRLLKSLRPGWDETSRRQKVAGAFTFLATRPQEAVDETP